MKDLNLQLNEVARDTALIQLLVKVRVNQFLLARIYANLYDSSDDEINRIVKRVEQEELAAVFAFLGKEASRAQMNSLLRPDHSEDVDK